MRIKPADVRKCLKAFDFDTLFREHLGWDQHNARLDLPIDGTTWSLTAVAEKRGFAAFVCDSIPDRPTRLKIDHQVAKSAREHFVIYADRETGRQVWQWVRRETGKPLASRDVRFDASTSGDLLIQKLDRIAFDLAEEDELTLVEVAGRNRAAFDVDRVTKKFYDRFKNEHAAFQGFIKGIKALGDLEWYTSLMLNRLMFVYFIQKKGFLDGDTDYLRHRMRLVREAQGKDEFQTFYRYFLVRLFHDGLGQHVDDRKLKPKLEKLLGDVPYLNGGFFEVHQLEERYTEIDVPDEAFEKLFNFFDEFSWHLDERPLRAGNEINPDVVGYIFEKYINQKQMGAYYTKEDITGYICKNTIIPFLFDAAEKKCPIAFKPGSFLWRLLRDDPDRYIYEAVRRGVIDDAGKVIPLPAEIATGIDDVTQRGGWNRPATEPYTLPTETWREHVARRQRCLELRDKLASGEVHTINDLITLNLDIWQFARDAIVNSEGPELLRAFWQAIGKVTVLDPTCGSGAFLFAALQILESLYSDCLAGMARFVGDLPATNHHPEKFKDFKVVLAQIDKHPSERYFVLKSIILNNLYGVDIMEEAVEICKLRLFLKLVAQVESADQIEPLPDIDFNIRAGNTLVGYVSFDEVRKARASERAGKDKQNLLLDDEAAEEIRAIEEEALVVERCFEQFRAQQTTHGGIVTAEDKQELRDRLKKLDAELDRSLAGEYGIDPESAKAFAAWKASHQPFHWCVEFFGIMREGGFDVIVGNPPYVSTSKVTYLSTEAKQRKLPDLYAHVLLRSLAISEANGRYGMIVPLSLTFSEDFGPLRAALTSTGNSWFSSFDNIPAAVFAGVSQRCTIWVGDRSTGRTYSSPMFRWRSVARAHLIPNVSYTQFNSLSNGDCIPKINSSTMLGLICRERGANDAIREVIARTRGAKHWMRFSPSARNFVSAFSDPPPCLNDISLRDAPASDTGSLAIVAEDKVPAAVVVVVGEAFFNHWLVLGDGFHVTSGNVASFVRLLEHIPGEHLQVLCQLGRCLLKRRNEALVFKRNAGKYVGNFNYRGHSWLTRRSDLVLLAGLGTDRETALEVFSYVQRVLAINEFAGEKSIPEAVKAKFRPRKPNESFEKATLASADKLIRSHFGFSSDELNYLFYSDVTYGAGATNEGE